MGFVPRRVARIVVKDVQYSWINCLTNGSDNGPNGPRRLGVRV